MEIKPLHIAGCFKKDWILPWRSTTVVIHFNPWLPTSTDFSPIFPSIWFAQGKQATKRLFSGQKPQGTHNPNLQLLCQGRFFILEVGHHSVFRHHPLSLCLCPAKSGGCLFVCLFVCREWERFVFSTVWTEDIRQNKPVDFNKFQEKTLTKKQKPNMVPAMKSRKQQKQYRVAREGEIPGWKGMEFFSSSLLMIFR